MNWSTQAILILSAVAGPSSRNPLDTPASALAESIASRMAKKIEAAKNRGGSPMAFWGEIMATKYNFKHYDLLVVWLNV